MVVGGRHEQEEEDVLIFRWMDGSSFSLSLSLSLSLSFSLSQTLTHSLSTTQRSLSERLKEFPTSSEAKYGSALSLLPLIFVCFVIKFLILLK